jgi:ASC-1-like (ASCH) protein
MKHEMNLYKEPFFRIKSGKKLIEVRLNDPKRQKISIGDKVEFSLLGSDEKILVKVIEISKFDSFENLYSNFDYKMFGHPDGTTLNDQISGERKYYTEKREEEFGVLGIHIRLL